MNEEFRDKVMRKYTKTMQIIEKKKEKARKIRFKEIKRKRRRARQKRRIQMKKRLKSARRIQRLQEYQKLKERYKKIFLKNKREKLNPPQRIVNSENTKPKLFDNKDFCARHAIYLHKKIQSLEAILREREKNMIEREKHQAFFNAQNILTLLLIGILLLFFALLIIESAKTTGKNVLKKASNWGISLNSIKMRRRKKLFSSTKGSKRWRKEGDIVSDEGNEDEKKLEEEMSLNSDH